MTTAAPRCGAEWPRAPEGRAGSDLSRSTVLFKEGGEGEGSPPWQGAAPVRGGSGINDLTRTRSGLSGRVRGGGLH